MRLFSSIFALSCLTPHLLRAPEGDGTGTPPPAVVPPAVLPAAPSAPPPAAPGANVGDPGWLNERIAQAKRSAEADLLKQYGVNDATALKALLDEGKKAVDATKTELQRKDDELAATKTVAAQATTYHKVLTERANAELKQLPEAAQTRITALVGDNADPVKLLEAIELAKAMSPAPATTTAPAAAGAPAGQGAPAQPKPPVPPAANTTGAAGGPPSATGSPPDHLANWKKMQEPNPFAAAHYYLANQADIVSAQQNKQ